MTLSKMDASTLLILLIAALALLILLVVLVNLRRGPGAYYVLRDTAIDADQSKRMDQLEAALGDRYRVLPRSRMADFVDVKPRISYRTRGWAMDRILDACFDFVLLDRQSPKVLGILMGDDEDQPRAKRKERKFVRKVCGKLGLPVVTLDAVLASDPDYLRNAVGHQDEAPAAVAEETLRQEPTLA